MRHLVLHGHFYQPPRENPWTERIDREASARPYHDWNERILRESYGPNRAARVLDADERIETLVNNYAGLSFDLGPTLVDWMRPVDPATLQVIVDADRESVDRLGHGNAMAQAYNHSILPLLTRRDKVTQVKWGLAHFRETFGRDAEGLWLPETAADRESLDVLAAEGVRFTILAPWQLASCRAPGEQWRAADGAGDLGRPYTVQTGDDRSLSVFFYEGEVSRGIAFEGLLKSGGQFADRLRAAAKGLPEEAPILTVATDGETYGHHHRFGEMALAFALRELRHDGDLNVTNGAALLAEHPAAWEAKVSEPGSWSCMHGVERWRSDCGCATGGEPGWTQAWRAPLYAGLVRLREALDRIFEERGAACFTDAWGARNAYIEVLMDPSPPGRERFLRTWGRPVEDPTEPWRLLEMSRHGLLMFTSCGWFFNDLSGIETLQVLRYAARAIQLAGVDLPQEVLGDVLSELEEARSNRAPHESGADMLRRLAHETRVDAGKVAAEAVLVKRLRLARTGFPAVPAYDTHVTPGEGETGRVEVRQRRTRQRCEFRYRVTVDDSPRAEVELDEVTARPVWESVVGLFPSFPAQGRVVSAETLDAEAARQITAHVLRRVERDTARAQMALVSGIEPVIRFLERGHVRPPGVLARLLEVAWVESILHELERSELNPAQAASWTARLGRLASLGLDRDDARLVEVVERRLREKTLSYCRGGGEADAVLVLALLDMVDELEPRADTWEAQNVFFVESGWASGGPDPPSDTLRRIADRLGFAAQPPRPAPQP